MTDQHFRQQRGAESPEAVGKDRRMVMQSCTPLNIEGALGTLEGAITPIEQFFVRNNSSMALIDPAAWSLRIDGDVDHPFTITYDELRRLPSISYVAVLECAGNGRARFAGDDRAAEGVQWGNGAIGNAEWVGVPVKTLLERAGVRSDAVQAECIGGDADGTTRGVEIEKLMDDAILAYAMNGTLLPPIHGGPVRLIVPGWGGINSIKWIVGMRVITGESQSHYNQEKYVFVDEYGEKQGKVRRIWLKSVIAVPQPDAILAAGSQIVRGFAWSPGAPVRAVEISSDGGATWQAARLLADLGPRSWRQWEWAWDATPGEYRLACRAIDADGNVQPMAVPFNRQGYGMHAIQTVTVHVR